MSEPYRAVDGDGPGGLPWSDLYPGRADKPRGLANAEYRNIRYVPSSTDPVLLAAANPARRRLVIRNLSTAVLYLGYGFPPTPTSFSQDLTANANYGIAGQAADQYQGDVWGVWAAVNGQALVGEPF